MSDQITVRSALAWAAAELRPASTTPRLDAELLLAHELGWSRARLLAGGGDLLDAERLADFRALVARRADLEPVAYLVGHKEFYGIDFLVDPRVLVPRPETELLVELALRYARRMTTDYGPQTTNISESMLSSVVGRRSSVAVADIGTGSGCIAVTLAKHLPTAEVLAVDLSPGALEVARANAERHGVAERVRLAQGDLLAPLDRPVDLLVSNPPYTVLGDVDEGVRRHEPRGALDGGPDGLDLYRRLLAEAPPKLRQGGAVLLEIGATQGVAVAELARWHFPNARITVHKDLAGLDRVVVIVTA